MTTLNPRSSTAGGVKHAPRLALATISLVLFLTFLDNTIVSVVLADVQSGLHAGVTALQWVVNGYALAFASLMLLFGTLGDMFGRKRVMLAGVATFCAGSVIAAVAPDVQVLIAGRVVMGIGAAASEPGTLSMIRHLYPDRRERARSLGVWAAVSGLALALGPVIGGLLSGVGSWRDIFWFNLAFGLVALAGAATVLPENADPVNRRLDLIGAGIGVVALGCLSFAIIAGETSGYHTWWVMVLFAVAAVAAVGFVAWERHTPNPVLDVRYFRRGSFSGSNMVAFATYFGVFAIFFFVALYLQVVASTTPYGTAVDFAPMAAGMVVASALTGRWVAASGPRLPMVVGCTLATAGILATNAFMSPHVGFSTLGWTLPMAGIGFGIAIVPVTSSALASLPAEHSGMAASMTNTSRELGAVVGVATLGSVVNGQLTVDLIHRLNALGIPKQFQSLVITAVTTGSIGSQAAAETKHAPAAISHLVNEVVTAAYGAFSHGLDLALLAAAAMMALSALVAGVAMPGRRRLAEIAAASGSALISDHIEPESPKTTTDSDTSRLAGWSSPAGGAGRTARGEAASGPGGFDRSSSDTASSFGAAPAATGSTAGSATGGTGPGPGTAPAKSSGGGGRFRHLGRSRSSSDGSRRRFARLRRAGRRPHPRRGPERRRLTRRRAAS